MGYNDPSKHLKLGEPPSYKAKVGELKKDEKLMVVLSENGFVKFLTALNNIGHKAAPTLIMLELKFDKWLN